MTSNYDYDAYLKWLVVNYVPDHGRYDELCIALFDQPFEWDESIRYDENRADDGLALRRNFAFENGAGYSSKYHGNINDVSFLEVYIGLAVKLGHLLDHTPKNAMNHLLRVGPFKDMVDGKFTEDELEETVSRVNNREYDASGAGGLFPLDNPKTDQTKVELLYQLNRYVQDQELG